MSIELSKEWFQAISNRSNVEIAPHIEVLLEVVPEIIEVAMDDFKSKTQFEYKDDNSPAGQADLAIETLLKSHLTSRYPAHYFKGEETPSIEPEQYGEGDKRWIVDPIDGTRNNEYGREDFAVAIALQEYQSGQWVGKDALLVMPVKGEMIWASENQGAYVLKYNPMMTREPFITAIKIDGENIRPFDKTVLDLSTKPYPPAEEGQLITAIREDRMTHRNVGSAAIAIANVGSKADGAIVLANDYDVAAGMLIAREAGAIVSEQVYETSRGPLSLVVAATSAQTHDALVQKCAALG